MLILVLIIGSLFLFARLWINDAFKQHQISDIHWQLGTWGLNQSKINRLEFTLQNRYKIELTNLEISWLFTKKINDSSKQAIRIEEQNQYQNQNLNHYIDVINIESAVIQNLSPANIQPYSSNTSNTKTLNQAIASAIKFVKLSSQGITPKDETEKSLNTLMNVFPYLPNTININHIEYSQPCQSPSSQNCSLSGTAHWKNQINAQQVVSHLTFNIQDKKHPNLNFHSNTQLLADLKSQQLIRTQLDSAISLFNKQNNQPLFSIDWKNQTSTQTKNHLKTQLIIQNLPGLVNKKQNDWQTLNQISQYWMGQSLPVVIAPNNTKDNTKIITKVNANINPKANINLKADIDLNAINLNPIDLGEANQINQDLLSTLLQNTEFNLNFFAHSQRPVTVKNQVMIKGKINGVLNAKNGVIKQYELESDGNLSFIKNSDINRQLQQYGVDLDDINYHITSLSEEAIPLTKEFISQLPFEISLKSKTLKQPLNQIKNSTFNLNLLGKIALNKHPSVEIAKGELSLFSPKLQLNSETQLKQAKAQLKFKGVANLANPDKNSNTWKLQSSNGFIQTEIKKTSQNQSKNKLNNKASNNQLTINNAKFSWKNLTIQQDNAKSLASIAGKIQSVAFTGNIQHPIAQAENFQLKLKNLRLDPVIKTFTDTKSITQTKHQLKAQYQFSTHQITQAHLLPQSWKGQGNLNVDLKLNNKTINLGNQVQLKGSISNKAGLVVFHNAFYTPTQIYSDWFIPPIYFLAGNSPQKTFADWPKLVSIGSGILQAKGSVRYKQAKIENSANWINQLEVKGNLSTKGLSGILNETTINQLTSQLKFELSKNQLIAKVQKLSIEQLNHGVIVGPITFKGDYTTIANQPIKGVLHIDNANTELFKGQAWLDSQEINLAKPFTSQLHLKNIDIQTLLKQYPSADIKGTGTILGNLPFSVNLLKKPFITLQKGLLQAKSPGGLIQYKPTSSGLKQTHQSMQLMMNVLEDFHYDLLQSKITYNDKNQLVLKLSLQGKNPAVESGRQVNFNIQLEEDLPALITSMQISNQVSETIKKRIQSKLQNTQQSN